MNLVILKIKELLITGKAQVQYSVDIKNWLEISESSIEKANFLVPVLYVPEFVKILSYRSYNIK